MVILNWRRPENVRRILDAYTRYRQLDDLIVWNNNPDRLFTYDHPKVRCINSPDCGLNTRWLASLLAVHDCIIVNDDDVICAETTIDDLIEYHQRDPDRSYTLQGRNPDHENAYAVRVHRVVAPTECEMHLTRTVCINRKFVPEYFAAIRQMDIRIDPERGGGEDIVFSYLVTSLTGKRPLVVPGTYTDLLAPHSIANRNGPQWENRTAIMRYCQRWFARRDPDTR
ncbi:MAG: hypothetical protein ACRELZ_17490 [Candidatus Rokuibacteriota bacterium]